MTNAYAIILAGGNGERFWPLSTPEKPKQFLSLFGGQPLITQAVSRLKGLFPPARIFVITAERLLAETRQALPMLPPENILGEPCRRDTAAAVALACGLVQDKGGSDVVGCILTADQLIHPAALFRQTLAEAIHCAATSNAIVTMGIPPTRPETGFGYIEAGDRVEGSTATTFRTVKRFVEKPNRATAAAYLAAGNFLWNAGMFIWKASTLKAAFAAHAPDFLPLIETRDYTRLYPNLRAISIDFAVMEHAAPILVAESRFEWDDVGSYLAVEQHFPQDAHGNTCLGEVRVSATGGSIVINQDPTHKVVVAGLQDVVVVQTATGTLVLPKHELPNLKAYL